MFEKVKEDKICSQRKIYTRLAKWPVLFHLSISLLRHYDKTGLVTPEYTDPDTGYRYYSIRQFECLINQYSYLRALDMATGRDRGFSSQQGYRAHPGAFVKAAGTGA